MSTRKDEGQDITKMNKGGAKKENGNKERTQNERMKISRRFALKVRRKIA